MKGIGNNLRSQVDELIEAMFDRMALRLLGNLPHLKNKKTLAITAEPNKTLAGLFIRSLNADKMLPREESVLKNLLSTAHGYIESLKHKTKTEIGNTLEAYAIESTLTNKPVSSVEIKNKVEKAFEKARHGLKTIAEAESTKVRNVGKAAQIARVGASLGTEDPNIFFQVLRDGVTCPECIRLHCMPDKITPRIWKLSQVGFSYHKKGESNPKIAGAHIHCRCTLTLLPAGFSFKDGSLKWVGNGYDEYEAQKSKA